MSSAKCSPGKFGINPTGSGAWGAGLLARMRHEEAENQICGWGGKLNQGFASQGNRKENLSLDPNAE